MNDKMMTGQRWVAFGPAGAVGSIEHTEDGYHLDQFAEDAIALMGELGHKTFTFVGHSMGGGIGIWAGYVQLAQRLESDAGSSEPQVAVYVGSG